MPTTKTTDKGITVKFFKVDKDAVAPSKRDGDAGWDLAAVNAYTVPPFSAGFEIHTGIAVELPPGYYVELFPRSSLGKHTAIRSSNSVGLIDNTYRGEIIALVDNLGMKTETINKGQRFCQLVIKKEIPAVFVEAEKLTDTERGTGKFGSTGE